MIERGRPEARVAADLAAELGDPTAVDVLGAALADPDANVWTRIDAAQALCRHSDDRWAGG